MRTLTRLTLALASVVALPAFASESTPLKAEGLAVHAAPLQFAPSASTPGMTPKAMGTRAVPGTPTANPYRAYPPSCAAYPLPDKSGGASWSGSTPLFAGYNAYGQPVTEGVTVTVWRLPCSSSGSPTRYNPDGGPAAMTFVRIDRNADNEGKATYPPFFPTIQAAQGAITDLATDPKTLVRVALEPNTVVSELHSGTAVYDSTTLVLENYAREDAGHFNFNNAFTLRVNPYPLNIVPLDLVIPAYEPSADTYPAAFAPRALDGYAAAQWVNGSDGLLVQVSEQYIDSKMTRQLVFDLLTEDLEGNPLWLVGNAAFEVGATSVDVETIYLGEGLSHEPWGKVTIKMPSCGALDVTFAPNADLPAPVPSLSGLATFGRLFDANGMVCE